MEFLAEYGLFLAKMITLAIAFVAVIGFLAAMAGREKGIFEKKGELHVTNIGERIKEFTDTLENAILSKEDYKARLKAEKHKAKEEKKQRKAKSAKDETGTDKKRRKRIFVLEFDGDIRASAVESLREEITAILTAAEPEAGDEVLLKLESSGGMVHSYGLASSQLQRIRDKGIRLTVAVDKVAASGGYMMACVADHIIAAPFAVVGSIGVLVHMPNFHRLLRKHEVDFEELTAGEYKRTLTLFGENTDKARNKLKEELEDTHLLFKDFITAWRPALDLSKAATGEHWYGTRAKALNLVDELSTSDDFLLAAVKDADLYQVDYVGKRHLLDMLPAMVSAGLDRFVFSWLQRDRETGLFK
ncbi:MAG: protease SohB [Gammaproteobacteria bacterium]|nr:protease SohB [Gammaproteobacteria bacterium]